MATAEVVRWMCQTSLARRTSKRFEPHDAEMAMDRTTSSEHEALGVRSCKGFAFSNSFSGLFLGEARLDHSQLQLSFKLALRFFVEKTWSNV